ncbi:MAG: hypothetical protein KJ587_05720 [Alphaproteobacteria bacterium]|nr:hypothetical protein [Alphaproteobacteria bacterium]
MITDDDLIHSRLHDFSDASQPVHGRPQAIQEANRFNDLRREAMKREDYRHPANWQHAAVPAAHSRAAFFSSLMFVPGKRLNGENTGAVGTSTSLYDVSRVPPRS